MASEAFLQNERAACSSLKSVLTAPHRAVRYFPRGDDALGIVDAEVQRRLQEIDAASDLEQNAAIQATLRFVGVALQWLDDACISELLNNCSDGEVGRISEEWLCIETELQQDTERSCKKSARNTS